MLEKIATFSEKLERKGLFDISDKIDKSIKTSANYQGYTFLGYDKNTNGLWYQGEGRYWYLPPGGKQWIPYTNLPGQGGVGQQSLTEDSFSQLYRDPETGYWTSLELQDMRNKTKQEASQAAVGAGALAVGVPASYSLANRNMNLLYENFSKNYRLIEENLAKIKTAKTDKEAQKFYLEARKAAEKAQKAYNRYQGWNKSTPGFDHLSPPQKKILDFRLKEIYKFNKIIETEKTPKGIINKIKNRLTAKQTAIKTQQAAEKIAGEMKHLQSKMDFSKNSISKLIKEFNSTKDINKKKELFRILQLEKQKMGEVYKSLLRYSNERSVNLSKYSEMMQKTENIFNNFSTNNPRLYQAVSEPLIKDAGDLLAKRVRNPRVNPAQTAGDIAEQAGRLGDDVARVTGETAEQAVKNVENLKFPKIKTGGDTEVIQNISKATKSSAKNIKNIENMANKSFRNLKNTLTNMRNYKSNPKMQQSLFRQALKEKQIFENFYRQLKTYKNNAGLGQLDTMMNSITNKFSQYQKAALKVEQKIGQSMSESQKFTQRFLVNLEKRGLLRSSKVLRFLKPMEQHVALSKLSEVMRLSKLGISAAKIATRVILPIGVVLDLITIGTAIYGGVQAYNAVQQARKNDWRNSPALVSLQTRLKSMTPQQRDQFMKNPANAGVVQALNGIGPEQIKSFWSTIVSRNEMPK